MNEFHILKSFRGVQRVKPELNEKCHCHWVEFVFPCTIRLVGFPIWRGPMASMVVALDRILFLAYYSGLGEPYLNIIIC